MTEHWLYQIRTEPVSTEPEQTTVDRWHKPLSEPSELLRVEGLHASLQQHLTWHTETPAAAEVVTVDQWYRALSEPLYEVEPLAEGAKPFFTIDTDQLTQPEVTTPDKWWPTFADMVHDAPSVVEFMPFATREAVDGDFETVTSDKWFRPLETPPDETPRYLATLYDQWAAQEALVFGENSWDNNEQAWDDSERDWEGNLVIQFAWFRNLDEPVRPLFDSNEMGINHFFYVPDPIVLGERLDWYQPFRDPTELRDLGLHVSLMPAFVIDAQFKLGFIGESPVAGAWTAEGAAAGVWGAESSALGTWIEEGPEC